MNRATLASNRTAPYQHSVNDVLATLDTGAQLGLSEAQARTRLKKYGRNKLAAQTSVPRWRQFLAQFTDVLVILLLVAALISVVLWLYERELTPRR